MCQYDNHIYTALIVLFFVIYSDFINWTYQLSVKNMAETTTLLVDSSSLQLSQTFVQTDSLTGEWEKLERAVCRWNHPRRPPTYLETARSELLYHLMGGRNTEMSEDAHLLHLLMSDAEYNAVNAAVRKMNTETHNPAQTFLRSMECTQTISDILVSQIVPTTISRTRAAVALFDMARRMHKMVQHEKNFFVVHDSVTVVAILCFIAIVVMVQFVVYVATRRYSSN